jgi:hypothetical protein
MALYDIAIDDGCMARLEINRNVIPGFDLRDFVAVFCFYDQATLFQMFNPATAAASAR